MGNVVRLLGKIIAPDDDGLLVTAKGGGLSFTWSPQQRTFS